MEKIYQKQIEALGFMRCPHCGNFTPQFIDTYDKQKVFLGIPFSKITKGYLLRCQHCKNEEMITQEQVNDYVDKAKTQAPYELQKKIWKQIYTAHKYLSADDDISKELGPFFNQVKKEARANIPFDITNKQFDYVFNAYLTNLTNSSKK